MVPIILCVADTPEMPVTTFVSYQYSTLSFIAAHALKMEIDPVV
jgi:hypothetical protein